MSCRNCESFPNCDGCNVNTLIKALENGKFDFDERHNIIIPDKIVQPKRAIYEPDMGYLCPICSTNVDFNDNFCSNCGQELDTT